jgi:hypothetical protein
MPLRKAIGKVHWLWCLHQLSAKMHPDGLMPQTDAEHRQCFGMESDKIEQPAGFLWGAWPWRKHSSIYSWRFPIEIGVVVAYHNTLRSCQLQLM